MRRAPAPSTLTPMEIAKRTEVREGAALTLRLDDGGSGLTRDVSTSGVYFESDAEQTVGSEIDFTIDFDTPSGPLHLKCHGEIPRRAI